MNWTTLTRLEAEKMNDAKKRWDAFFKSYSRPSGEFRVVVTGQQNSGKSTLCNALCNDLHNKLFHTGDMQTTKTNQEFTDKKTGITYVDTPGFGTTRESDTSIPRETWPSANLILFLHSVLLGELHKEEVHMLKELTELLPNADQRILFLCTKFGALNSDQDLASIVSKISKQVREIVGSRVQIHAIDSKYYLEGTLSEDKELTDFSKVPYVPEWIKKNREIMPSLEEAMFKEENSKYLGVLEEIQKIISRSLDETRNKKQRKISSLQQFWRNRKTWFEQAWRECAKYK